MLQKKSEYLFFNIRGSQGMLTHKGGKGNKDILKTNPCEDKKHSYKYLQFSLHKILYKP